jgi:hypothetical protein
MELRRSEVSVRRSLVTLGVLVVFLGLFPAAAAARGKPGGGGGGQICGSSNSSNCGFDVSYPQCGATLPSLAAFAIVGVNGGLANDYNSCLSSELSWASTSTGSTSQPPASLYLNTADPGDMYNGKPISDWPTSSIEADPYGSCVTTTVTVRVRGHNASYIVGENSDACAWQYGYDLVQGNNILQGDVPLFEQAARNASVSDSPAMYTWWLDVETANSWQTDATMNVADLEGMIAALQANGVTGVNDVGVYSTSAQWDSIAGGTPAPMSPLYQIPNWIPGATNESGAQSNCSLPSFTGGSVTLTQWTGTFDSDYACPSA